MKDDHQRIPPHECLKCGHKHDCVTIAFEKETPMPGEGDWTMCLACGYMMAFNKDLSVRHLTPDEQYQMMGREDITMMQMARANVVGDKIKLRREKKPGTSS